MNRITLSLGAMAMTAGSLLAAPVAAQEVTLRAASSFAVGTSFSREFEAFVERVNEMGEGLVQIDFIGGPEALPPFEVGSAVSSGVIDMANVTGAFYGNLLPIADALKLATFSTSEMRENGAYDVIRRIHADQMNVHYLARTGIGTPFHIYLTQPIDGPSLEGLRIRTTSVYRAFIDALGGVPVQTAPGEVYTALERGQVEGYGWPAQGILDLGWHEHTNYRVDPGIYNVEVAFLVNMDTWNAMTDEQRDFLTDMAIWAEGQNDLNPERNEADYQLQAEAGVETITLSDEDAERWLTLAYDAAWDEAMSVDPEVAAELRPLIGDR
ncbi:MAG: TRAP transporter substrate-binding protein DctP [Pararhodobacter sp.]|nr:TRAP transporter substrate-binding protein DctP [Pararhodobacter sp.]